MNLLAHVTELQTNAWMTAVVEPHGNFPPLAETSEHQYSLNSLTQRSLPALPYSAWKLDPVLVAQRLRFGSPAGGTPFRGPLDPAVLYAAPTKKAALMDMAHHRWRFLNQTHDGNERSRQTERANRRSAGNRVAGNALSCTSRLTVFEVRLRTYCVDLRGATLQQYQHPRHHRTDSPNTRRSHNDFQNTQRIGRLARAANIGALVYAWPSDRIGASEAPVDGETHGIDQAHGADQAHGTGEAHGAGDNWRIAILDPDAFWLGDIILVREVWSMRVTRRHVEFHPSHGETSVTTDQWRHVTR